MNASCAPRSRRIGVGVAAAASALFALAGCATGQHAQTAAEVPAIDGVGAQIGSIALRAVTVAPPAENNYAAGTDADLQLVIVNQGATDDKLVGVTTPAADEVRLFADQADSTFTPLPTPSTSASESATGTGSGTASGTGTATDTGTPTGAPTDTGTGTGTGTPADTTGGTDSGSATSSAPPTIESIDLVPGHSVSIGYTPDLEVIQLHGLTKQLFPAQTFPITFKFEKAGSVTFTVAVHLAAPPSSRPSIDISPTGEG